MGTHPIFESDFDCLTEVDSFVIDQGQTRRPNQLQLNGIDWREKLKKKQDF